MADRDWTLVYVEIATSGIRRFESELRDETKSYIQLS
jgi:hypothetical protein